MQRRQFLAAAAATPALLAGCGSMSSMMPSASGASSLTNLVGSAQKYMGLNADQTTAALGSMFGLAQNKLPAADFAELSKGLPGLGDLIGKGTSLTGVSPSSLTSMKAVTDSLSKLNVSPRQISQLSDYVTGAMGSSTGSAASRMLSKAWL